MKRIACKSHGLSLVAALVAACLAAGVAGAQDQLTWPVEPKLVHMDPDVATTWVEVGDVEMKNDRANLTIGITPYADLFISEVAIHIVQLQAPDEFPDFSAVLDRRGAPRPNRFDYKTDYLGDYGVPEAFHEETIPLDTWDLCWGVNPDTCPPDLYVIVAVELVRWVDDPDLGGWWQSIGETAYAENGGVFDRVTGPEPGLIWAYYVTYPLAKSEPGHFIDANVNGLAYQTPTHSGTTGEEGQFWFLPDERVAFSVGSLPLGDALADRRVSPVDLFPGSDLEDDRVLNVARLLQSLDADGNPGQGAINITEPVVACLEGAMDTFPGIPPLDFSDDAAVGALISATVASCDVPLVEVSKEEALANLNNGQNAGNLMRRNVSKTPEMKSDKAKIEIMPVYVPALTSDGSDTDVYYYDADGEVIEVRDFAKPIVVAYLDEVEGTGASDVFVAISRDDGETWKRRNISRTADKSSLLAYPGNSEKPMLKVKDNLIFVAWTDKYCRGGRPGYAITVCPDTDGDGTPNPPCDICRTTPDGTTCVPDYPGDDAYWQDDIFGVGGPQRTVVYDDFPELGEVPYSCVWTSRGTIDPATGAIQWFKPERVSSGRRDAAQLFAGAGDDVAFAIVWQEDPKGLMAGEGDGPGDGWSGANTHSKTDIWFSYITESDFALVDADYPVGGPGDGDDIINTDPELAGRVKALVPMSLPVKISDNDVCSLENMDPDGGGGEHDFDGEGEGTHRYCGTVENIGTPDAPGTNPLCIYTVEKENNNGEIHHNCVTQDLRLLDGNTGASRPMIFVQPYTKSNGTKSAWVIIGYEESKGVGTPPEEGEGDDPCGGAKSEPGDDHYKPDVGKNVIYHSFELFSPETASGGGMLNLPETDENGNPVYLVDEFGELLLDWRDQPILATENARRVRFIVQGKGKAGPSKTVLVALYRQGEEGSGKPADIFMRRLVAPPTGPPYAFGNFLPGAKNLSSVEATELFQDPWDAEAPVKMLRWAWSPDNLEDSSADNPYTDALAHRGAIDGDELIIAYSLTPNWGRLANDKYDLFVRRSFDGGHSWTTDPSDTAPIEHNVVFRVPVLDEVNQTVIWDEEVVTTEYAPGASEPPRNVSNLRNNRTSVLEPRLVKTPGSILDATGYPVYPEDERAPGVFQVAYGVEFNQNQPPNDVPYPKMPLDIYYGRTLDKGQRYESVVVTPQGGSGKRQEGMNLLAKDQPEQGAAQIRQTPDGSRMYAIWLEESDQGSDIMFRRVDYR